MRRVLPAVLFAAALIGMWQLAAELKLINPIFFPSPGRTFGELYMQETVVLPPAAEIAKVLDRIENAQPLEFDFNPFGPYYVGQRPFIGILLLALVAAS